MAFVRRFCGVLGILALASCQPTPEKSAEIDHGQKILEPDAQFLSPVSFSDLPDWGEGDLRPALAAFRRTCAAWALLPDDRPVSNRASYGGVLSDWRPACSAAADETVDIDPVIFFERHFEAFKVVNNDQDSKLTGYYEPVVEARARPEAGFEAPIPGIPSDLVTIDLGLFEKNLEGRKIWGKFENGSLGLYPSRAEIEISPEDALGYAHPTDVFFLQIQGSGRLVFDDGRQFRAAFAAHNHRNYVSLGRHLLREGLIEPGEASMEGIRDWMDRVSANEAKTAMNINPRYIFFQAEEISSPEAGPRGAQGVPLTPMGSIAVDLNHHPLGVPIFVSSVIRDDSHALKEFNRLTIAQDTGGAIVGRERADLFFGWGDEAGKRAGSTNHEVSFWVLLPNTLSEPRDDEKT